MSLNSKQATLTAPGNNTPKGWGTVVNPTTATIIPAVTGSKVAIIQAETGGIRYRDDGTPPTSTVGMLIPANTSVAYQGDLTTIKVIQASGAATVNILYYG